MNSFNPTVYGSYQVMFLLHPNKNIHYQKWFGEFIWKKVSLTHATNQDSPNNSDFLINIIQKKAISKPQIIVPINKSDASSLFFHLMNQKLEAI